MLTKFSYRTFWLDAGVFQTLYSHALFLTILFCLFFYRWAGLESGAALVYGFLFYWVNYQRPFSWVVLLCVTIVHDVTLGYILGITFFQYAGFALVVYYRASSVRSALWTQWVSFAWSFCCYVLVWKGLLIFFPSLCNLPSLLACVWACCMYPLAVAVWQACFFESVGR